MDCGHQSSEMFLWTCINPRKKEVSRGRHARGSANGLLFLEGLRGFCVIRPIHITSFGWFIEIQSIFWKMLAFFSVAFSATKGEDKASGILSIRSPFRWLPDAWCTTARWGPGRKRQLHRMWVKPALVSIPNMNRMGIWSFFFYFSLSPGNQPMAMKNLDDLATKFLITLWISSLQLGDVGEYLVQFHSISR